MVLRRRRLRRRQCPKKFFYPLLLRNYCSYFFQIWQTASLYRGLSKLLIACWSDCWCWFYGTLKFLVNNFSIFFSETTAPICFKFGTQLPNIEDYLKLLIACWSDCWCWFNLPLKFLVNNFSILFFPETTAAISFKFGTQLPYIEDYLTLLIVCWSDCWCWF